MGDFSAQYREHSSSLPRFNAMPKVTGVIRQKLEDFIVNETLSFEPSGAGEHLFLRIEKRGCNTEWVAKQLQKFYGLRSQDIGYAGKKDRHSVSTQWFSCHLPGLKDHPLPAENESFKVVAKCLHAKKLRKGSIASNHFEIVMREVQGSISEVTLENIKSSGFPNYFGYQRFGHCANNLIQAEQFLKGEIKIKSRDKKGMLLSAARAFLFNLQVAKRLDRGNWLTALDGDCFHLNGSHSYFHEALVKREIQDRLNAADIHISGWLPGKVSSQASAQAALLESEAIADFQFMIDGLVSKRVDSARRSMRAFADNIELTKPAGTVLKFSFSLPSGSFATSFLRELAQFTDIKSV
ncbi:tRNA pseudouridine(13) synthase TruD [Aliikangiella sp. IMCC44632]